MECFENFILSQQICTDEGETLSPSSGLYIENLEGISIQTAAAIADGKYKTGRALIAAKVEFALKKLKVDVEKCLTSRSVKFTGAQTFSPKCKFTKDCHETTAAERGLMLSQNVASKYTAIRFDKILIQSCNEVDNVDVVLCDGYGVEIKRWTINLKANRTYPINAQGIKITTNTAYISIADERVKPAVTVCGANCGCSKTGVISRRGYDDTGETDSTFGVAVCGAVVCCFDTLFCEYLQDFKWAALYAAGIEILKEFGSSDRLNYVTCYGVEWAEIKLIEWENERKKYLACACEKMAMELLSKNDFCVACCAPVQVAWKF